MALTKAPLFGLDAGGTLGGAIVFSKWKGRTYVRRHAIPHNPKSGLQVGMRAMFKFISQQYAVLPAPEVEEWKLEADKTGITPMNAQMRVAQQNCRLGLGPKYAPSSTGGTTPNAPTGGAAAAAPKTLVLSWSHPGSNPGDYATMIWMSETGTFTRSTATLIAVIPQADLTYTVRGLQTGKTYYFEVAETLESGVVGASSTEFSGTPT